jgi:hypothetical protein
MKKPLKQATQKVPLKHTSQLAMTFPHSSHCACGAATSK